MKAETVAILRHIKELLNVTVQEDVKGRFLAAVWELFIAAALVEGVSVDELHEALVIEK